VEMHPVRKEDRPRASAVPWGWPRDLFHHRQRCRAEESPASKSWAPSQETLAFGLHAL